MRLDELFDVEYGNKLDMNKMSQVAPGKGVTFVGRKGSEQGVSGYVEPVDGVEPFPAGALTVALGGSILASFIQQRPFYTAQNVAVLTPRLEMSLQERLYYATCIQANRFRYTAFGREANRSLRTIQLPDAAPAWVTGMQVTFKPDPSIFGESPSLSGEWDPQETVPLSSLFSSRYGQSLELNRLAQVKAPVGVNFVSRAMRNNGITARVHAEVTPGVPGEVTVALGGNGVLSSFVQPEPFVCGRDVMILTAKDENMTFAEKLYYAQCIWANRHRYSYGRQANRTLGDLLVPAAPPAWLAEAHKTAVNGGLFHE